mmetsp:Transcript_150830/g.482822  ORF Transcript_150830/g.482822 Transcript_150830/m.482822 type:complete len:241 (-) Transcript_150830:2042-2764(-)
MPLPLPLPSRSFSFSSPQALLSSQPPLQDFPSVQPRSSFHPLSSQPCWSHQPFWLDHLSPSPCGSHRSSPLPLPLPLDLPLPLAALRASILAWITSLALSTTSESPDMITILLPSPCSSPFSFFSSTTLSLQLASRISSWIVDPWVPMRPPTSSEGTGYPTSGPFGFNALSRGLFVSRAISSILASTSWVALSKSSTASASSSRLEGPTTTTCSAFRASLGVEPSLTRTLIWTPTCLMSS